MCVATSVAVTAITSFQPISTLTLKDTQWMRWGDYQVWYKTKYTNVEAWVTNTYISSICPSAGAKSFEHARSARRGGGVGGAAGRGAAAAVRYGFRILHCYLPPDLGHSAGLRKWQRMLKYVSFMLAMSLNADKMFRRHIHFITLWIY